MATTQSYNKPTIAGVKKFTIMEDIPMGESVVNHNLGLASPYATIVDVRDPAGSSRIIGVINPTSNSITLKTNAPILHARITILG